jgi:hypothetical protein
VQAVGVSLLFDPDLKNELDWLDGQTFWPEMTDQLLDPRSSLSTESDATQAGQVVNFTAGVTPGTSGDGPADTSFLLGQARFVVTSHVTRDGRDVEAFFTPGLDGAFDNMYQPLTPIFGTASVSADPEPGTFGLLASGLVALAIGRRRRRGPTLP